MISWMLYALAVGVLVALAARGMEEVCRLMRLPIRWVWAGALLAALVLIATAPARVSVPATVMIEPMVAGAANAGSGPIESSVAGGMMALWQATVAAVSEMPIRRAFAAAGPLLGTAADRLLLPAWIALSGLVLLSLLWTALHYHSVRRRSPSVSLFDATVRITEKLGPAVIGILRPQIVLPRWLLNAPVADQRLIVAHELEHCRARDPLVLLPGWVAIVLLPWHPAVWWMASRLRLATEMDCDARVLRRGVDPLPYGHLLIDVARHSSPLRAGAAGLSASPSHLERRLRAMIPTSRRFVAVRGVLVGMLAALALVAACEAPMPTSTMIEKMDVTAAEEGARSLGLFGLDSEATEAEYSVDGIVVPPEKARSIPREQIARIVVRIPEDPAFPAQVLVETRNAPAGAPEEPPSDFSGRHVGYTMIAPIEQGEAPIIAETEGPPFRGAAAGIEPLILIDGRQADAAALQAINRSPAIESIQVIKGAQALAEYGVEGAGGVVLVTTKSAVGRAGAAAESTGMVTGSVIDPGGAPVAGAAVTVGARQKGTLTNRAGRFAISGLPPGTHTLNVSVLNARDVSKTVTVSALGISQTEIRIGS